MFLCVQISLHCLSFCLHSISIHGYTHASIGPLVIRLNIFPIFKQPNTTFNEIKTTNFVSLIANHLCVCVYVCTYW